MIPRIWQTAEWIAEHQPPRQPRPVIPTANALPPAAPPPGRERRPLDLAAGRAWRTRVEELRRAQDVVVAGPVLVVPYNPAKPVPDGWVLIPGPVRLIVNDA